MSTSGMLQFIVLYSFYQIKYKYISKTVELLFKLQAKSYTSAEKDNHNI
jgi:hypothetical protein